MIINIRFKVYLMNRFCASILLFGLALFVSGCAGTPPTDGNAQARQDCNAPMQTGSLMGRRACRDRDNGANDDEGADND